MPRIKIIIKLQHHKFFIRLKPPKMKHYSKRKDEVWEKGAKIRGKDPKLYRRDTCGNIMYYHSYGKNSPSGWVIDHSKPRNSGGTDHLNNLQPLNTSLNQRKGKKHPFKCTPTTKRNKKPEHGFPWVKAALILAGVVVFSK